MCLSVFVTVKLNIHRVGSHQGAAKELRSAEIESRRKVNVWKTFSHKCPYRIAQPLPLIKKEIKLKFMPKGYKS